MATQCPGKEPMLLDTHGYGYCPDCRRWWKLTKSGEIRKHRASDEERWT